MPFRLLFFTIIIFTSLYAVPSLSQLQEAVKANPALLKSPQAEKILKDKGLSLEDVEKRLETDGSKKAVVSEDNSVINNIDTNTSTVIDTNASIDNEIEYFQNPFNLRTDLDIKDEVVKRQQAFSKSKLLRYSKHFYSNKNQIDSASLPTPDDYIISGGDLLSVHVYGDRDEEYALEVKNDGTVEIPFIGPVQVGGMTFKEVKQHLTKKLSHNFKMSSFNISISKYSTIQVTLVGEVKTPGIYNLSSFSTVKDLLVTANGIQDNASIRDVIIKRNTKTIARLDFYDLLFKGQEFGSVLLKHGDIVVINKAKTLVSIDGYVNHAAIFELKANEKLDKLIAYAGGMKPEASKLNVKIERYRDNKVAEAFELSYAEAKNFKMQDGDRVYIFPLDFTAQSSVNIYGNIIRPGNYNLGSEKTLNALLKENLKWGKKKFFLPQTYFEYGVVKSYTEDLRYTTTSFNLAKVITGDEVIKLSSQDEIYIFSKNDIFSNSYITTVGEILIKPGKFQYFHGMCLEDAVRAAGIDGVIDDKIRLTTFDTQDRMPKTRLVSLKENGSTKLSPYDEIEVYDFYKTHALEPVSIQGEVLRPSLAYYEQGLSLADLVEFAGGFTMQAYLKSVEIVRYSLDNNSIRQREVIQVNLSSTKLSDVALMPFDEISVHKIPRWSDKKSVKIVGMVQFPGTYTIDDGDRLSDILKRVGGFREEAFVEGTVFSRESIRQNEISQRNSSMARIKRELAIYNAMPANAKQSPSTGQANATLNEVIEEAAKYEPLGRISIKLDENLSALAESHYNLILQDKDTIFIPGMIDTVTVFGEVFNPNSFIYNPDNDGLDYIEMASGFSKAANVDDVYVIHADGTSEPMDKGWFSSCVDIQKGDTIVVPLYIKEINTLGVWESIAKILTSFALTAAAIDTLSN